MLSVEWFQRKKEHCLELSKCKSITLRHCIYILVLLWIFIAGGYAENFIYFQF